MRRIDLTGQRFGRLIALRFAHITADGRTVWRCLCDCGQEVDVNRSNLRSGGVQSCGCLRKQAQGCSYSRDGKATREYTSWHSMKGRCSNPKDDNFKHYGGRGIRVCSRWLSTDGFVSFLADMGPRPARHTLDRINVNGHYEPGNCRWATAREQRLNQRPRKAA